MDSTNKLQPYPVTVGNGETNTKGDFGYYRNVTTPAGVIGNQVWYETDHDGLYEPQNGEIGVAGVVVRLTPPAGVDAGAGGAADHDDDGCGRRVCVHEPAGGDVQRAGDRHLRHPDGLPGDGAGGGRGGQQQPGRSRTALRCAANGINTTADFGYYKLFDFTIEKTLDTLGDIRIGEQIKFTVKITNNGTAPITVLPLTDTFDSAYLQFVSATPVTPNSGPAIGPVVWNDLTGSAPNGFGVDLAPAANFAIVLTFTAKADTTQLPNQVDHQPRPPSAGPRWIRTAHSVRCRSSPCPRSRTMRP